MQHVLVENERQHNAFARGNSQIESVKQLATVHHIRQQGRDDFIGYCWSQESMIFFLHHSF
jgi:hypothetical protein